MAQIVRIEKNQRGFFGTVFKWLFIVFNGLMLIWLVAGIATVSDRSSTLSGDAERAGAAIGSALGIGMILILWALGAIILGLFTMMTKGKKIIVEEIRGE